MLVKVIRLRCQTWMVFISLVISFVVSTGGVGWAADPIDFSKPYARTNPYVAGAGVAAAAATTYCDAATTCTSSNGECDILCESFESSTDCDGAGAGTDSVCFRSYTVGYETGTVDFTTTPSATGACSDRGTNAVQIARSAGADNLYVRYDAGSAKNITYSQFYFYVDESSLASSQTSYLYEADSDSFETQVGGVKLRNSAGTYRLAIIYYNSSSGTTETTGSTTAISLDTWYRCVLLLDTTGGTITLWVGTVGAAMTQELTSSTLTTSRHPLYFYLMSKGNHDAATTVTYDNWKIDSDNTPGACN